MSLYNNKYTKWLVGALVLMNMVLLFAFFSFRPAEVDPPKENHSEKIQKYLKQELNLSADQAVKFKSLRKAYFEEKKEKWEAIKKLKKEMMDAISTETPDTEKAQDLANQIGALEAGKEKLLINHYLNLQAECTPEQREKLEQVFRKAMKRSKHRKGKKGQKKNQGCD